MNSKDANTHAWLRRISNSFREFSQAECQSEPLYFALCEIIADTPQIVMLLQEAAPEQQRPNLLLAAVHFLVLSRASEDPLAAYFPSVGGNRSVDSQLRDAFASFCSILNGELRELIATRTTQTNEIGRCAVLWPILQFVVMDQPQKSIALLDFGCSAGLNLGVDRFQYQYNMDASRTLDSNVPIIKCQWHGSIPPRSDQKADVRIIEKVGIDIAPLRVNEEADALWLMACVWPHDEVRRSRLGQAIQMARTVGWKIEQHANCTNAAEEWVSALPDTVTPVIFNSWVLTYLPADALAEHVRRMHALVCVRRIIWISAEQANVRVSSEIIRPVPSERPKELAEATVWTVSICHEGRSVSKIVARSHPHGKWAEWFGPR